MLPTAYEFHWDLGHIVFFGVFYTVVALLLLGLGLAVYWMFKDLRGSRHAVLKWKEDFHALPADRQRCRFELTGRLKWRPCHNEFNCNTCNFYKAMQRDREDEEDLPDVPDFDLAVEGSRRFHRGHSWVEATTEGRYKVGLDSLAWRCLGEPDSLSLPAVGSRLRYGQRAFWIQKSHLQVAVVTPLAGKVVEHAKSGDDWLILIEPDQHPVQLDHLLTGREAKIWMLRETEQLQTMLQPGQEKPALADGGSLVQDLMAACPEANWDTIWGKLFLDM